MSADGVLPNYEHPFSLVSPNSGSVAPASLTAAVVSFLIVEWHTKHGPLQSDVPPT